MIQTMPNLFISRQELRQAHESICQAINEIGRVLGRARCVAQNLFFRLESDGVVMITVSASTLLIIVSASPFSLAVPGSMAVEKIESLLNGYNRKVSGKLTFVPDKDFLGGYVEYSLEVPSKAVRPEQAGILVWTAAWDVAEVYKPLREDLMRLLDGGLKSIFPGIPRA